MNLQVLKTIAIVLAAVIVLLAALLVVLIVRRNRAPETPAPTAAPVPTAAPSAPAAPTASPSASPAAAGAPDYKYRAGDLDGTWIDTRYPDSELRFTKKELSWKNVFDDSGSCSYTVEKSYSGLAEGAMRIEFPDYSGPFEYLIWHREEIDGRLVGVLSGVIMEYDGRGPVTFNEFLREADGVSVPEDWRSEVSHTLNDHDPAPTWVDPDRDGATE